jgi:hypothetical protein
MLFHSIPSGQQATQSSRHTTSPAVILSTPKKKKNLTTLHNERPMQVETRHIKDQLLLQLFYLQRIINCCADKEIYTST